MAEELYDMSLRIDPNPSPSSPSAAVPPTSENPSSAAAANTAATTTADIRCSGADTPVSHAATNPIPSAHAVTQFAVRPSATVEGKEVRRGAYWKGGVGAHYRNLEDKYM